MTLEDRVNIKRAGFVLFIVIKSLSGYSPSQSLRIDSYLKMILISSIVSYNDASKSSIQASV